MFPLFFKKSVRVRAWQSLHVSQTAPSSVGGVGNEGSGERSTPAENTGALLGFLLTGSVVVLLLFYIAYKRGQNNKRHGIEFLSLTDQYVIQSGIKRTKTRANDILRDPSSDGKSAEDGSPSNVSSRCEIRNNLPLAKTNQQFSANAQATRAIV